MTPRPPIEPMLAKLARELPDGDMLFEPKWDGFRCIVFRELDELVLQSRNGKDLARYFPELTGEGGLAAQLPQRVVLDGELVVAVDERLDFDALSNRVHPAQSRVDLLAATTPAQFVAFDLLGLDDEDLMARPFSERRDRLSELLEHTVAPVHLTPATRSKRQAADWFARFEGAGLDGVIAKPLDGVYEPGKRSLLKIKQERTADVVVAGFRWHKDGEGIGSLLLGLYDDGELIPVGVASSFSAAKRRELVEVVESYRVADDVDHPWDRDASPRGVNRWNAGRDTSWQALRIALVAEVAYEQLTGNRFRHSARLKRFRPDRDPTSCDFAQLEVPPAAELADLFRQTG